MRYRFTRAAVDDLDVIGGYIARDTPNSAPTSALRSSAAT